MTSRSAPVCGAGPNGARRELATRPSSLGRHSARSASPEPGFMRMRISINPWRGADCSRNAVQSPRGSTTPRIPAPPVHARLPQDLACSRRMAPLRPTCAPQDPPGRCGCGAIPTPWQADVTDIVEILARSSRSSPKDVLAFAVPPRHLFRHERFPPGCRYTRREPRQHHDAGLVRLTAKTCRAARTQRPVPRDYVETSSFTSGSRAVVARGRQWPVLVYLRPSSWARAPTATDGSRTKDQSAPDIPQPRKVESSDAAVSTFVPITVTDSPAHSAALAVAVAVVGTTIA